mgnify:CR=1 FL=1
MATLTITSKHTNGDILAIDTIQVKFNGKWTYDNLFAPTLELGTISIEIDDGKSKVLRNIEVISAKLINLSSSETSIDAGNVIVISWVMPCGPCATYSLPAYSAVQSFATTHPGRVHFYMADDYANTTCQSLISWGNNNNMPNSTFFSSSDINMSDYGTAGMPKVVVLGGSDHTIFYNQNESHITFNGTQTAISEALAAPLAINEQQNNKLSLISFPNPVQNDLLNISYKIDRIENITFNIVNILGETVLTFNDHTVKTIGQNKTEFDVSKLTHGIYFLKLSTRSYTETLRFVVAQ